MGSEILYLRTRLADLVRCRRRRHTQTAIMMAARAAAPTPAPMPAFTAVESPVVAASVLGVDAGAEVAVGPEVPEVVDSEDTETGTEAVGDGDAEVAEDET